ncbi:hypothetical protein MML48_3g00004637 [Holotrichia oblita]|uniref:Uncharacterized protein n=1 Tax=Holotrichia oblita TaxID=644536 RepID=A0ACB9TC20_HOLOL|nr:hypothetical protein MML48_3g00004637 [Holotrichia oblita]
MANNNVQQHYQTAAQQQGQLDQQQGNSSAYHCKECGIYLNSAQSLEVHLQYHKENLLNKWATQAATSGQHNNTEETNNNTKSSHQIKREFIPNTIAAAADSSDSTTMKKSPDYANRSTPETNNTNNTGFGHPQRLKVITALLPLIRIQKIHLSPRFSKFPNQTRTSFTHAAFPTEFLFGKFF